MKPIYKNLLAYGFSAIFSFTVLYLLFATLLDNAIFSEWESEDVVAYLLSSTLFIIPFGLLIKELLTSLKTDL